MHAGSRMSERQFRLILVGCGAMAALPLILLGFPSQAHDTITHLRWSHNFANGFWAGTLYPRWLPDLNFGCGSPAFFYYPPVPYWASSLFAPLAGLAGPEAAAWRALGWASSLGLILSGQTAYGCFRALTSPIRACVMAAVYMIAPYHLSIDLLERAAYAEFWAFAWMPLAFEGLIRLAKDGGWAWEKLVCGLALLFMTHLPTTLIFMPFVLLFALAQGTRTYARAFGGIAAACGVAAAFLVPALTTQGSTNLRRDAFPYELTFFFPNMNLESPLFSMDGFNLRLLWSFVLLVLVWFICYGVAVCERLTWATGRDRMVWLGLGLVALLMMLPPGNVIYKLIPVFQWIQFAWRFLAPATLIICVLIIVFWPTRDSSHIHRVLHAATICGIAMFGICMAWMRYEVSTLAPADGLPNVQLNAKDVNEYLPCQGNIAAARDLSGQMGNSRTRILDGTAQLSVLTWEGRFLQLQVKAATAAQVLVRQFYYPGWTARTAENRELAVVPHKETGLLLLAAPRGEHALTVRLTAGPAEKTGWTVTLLTLAGCVFKWRAGRRRGERRDEGCELHETRELTGANEENQISSPVPNFAEPATPRETKITKGIG